MISTIRHVGIVVSDLEASLNFWCDVLGFTVIRRLEESGSYVDLMMGLDDVQVTTVKLSAPDGGLIELLKFHSHVDEPTWGGRPFSTGLTHVAFTVENLQDVFQKLCQAGVIFPNKPQLSPDGKAMVIYGKGPEGILLEFVEIIEM